MQVIYDKKTLKEAIKNSSIVLVPTMGNLHSGHIELVKIAAKLKAKTGAKILTTIFVNPMQFGANEDLDKYPRTLDADLAKLENAACDLVFVPKVRDIYPEGVDKHTKIRVPQVSEGLCAKSRPTHFEGVASIVAKLLLLSRADYAIFGEKDYQQLALIGKMVTDLEIPTEIIGAPIIRSATGLALSSRNGYLSAQELEQAGELYASLLKLRDEILQADILGKNFEFAKIEKRLSASRDFLNKDGWRLDYLEIRDQNLNTINANTEEFILLVAAYLGKTRLLDNLKFSSLK